MARYKIITQDDSGDIVAIQDTETGAFIPAAPDNCDWREFVEWQAAGNEPDPMGGA